MAAYTYAYTYDLCSSAESKGHRLWHTGTCIWAIYAVHPLRLS